MASDLIGTIVILKRPVIVKDGYTRQGGDKANTFVPAQVEMKDTPALVVGTEPQYDAEGEPRAPKLHLAFVHPGRLHTLGGSGWRECFDRTLSVLPQTDEAARNKPLTPRWRGLDEPDLTPAVAKSREYVMGSLPEAPKRPTPTPVAPTPVKPALVDDSAPVDGPKPSAPEPDAKNSGKKK